MEEIGKMGNKRKERKQIKDEKKDTKEMRIETRE